MSAHTTSPTHHVHDLTTPEDVDAVLAESRTAPILLFKHSETCGISAQAWDELSEARASLPVALYVISVQAGRAASSAVAERLGIRHESPQLLLVGDGRARWTASHFRITGDAARRADAEHAAAAGIAPSV